MTVIFLRVARYDYLLIQLIGLLLGTQHFIVPCNTNADAIDTKFQQQAGNTKVPFIQEKRKILQTR